MPLLRPATGASVIAYAHVHACYPRPFALCNSLQTSLRIMSTPPPPRRGAPYAAWPSCHAWPKVGYGLCGQRCHATSAGLAFALAIKSDSAPEPRFVDASARRIPEMQHSASVAEPAAWDHVSSPDQSACASCKTQDFQRPSAVVFSNHMKIDLLVDMSSKYGGAGTGR